MYIWNLSKLKTDLKAGPLAEKEIFLYLCLYTVLYGLAFIPFPGTITYNVWDALSGLLTTLVTLFGLYYVYRQNGGADGGQFAAKYLSVGFVFGVRWCVMIALPAILLFYIGRGILSTLPDTTTYIDVLFLTALGTHYFWKLGGEIKELR